MNRNECIKIVKEHSWDYLVFNHASEIEESFWEEFISEVDMETLLQRTRLSDEFMENFKSTMGEDLYKKYKAIYYLCDLSDDDEGVYYDIVKTYLSKIKGEKEIEFLIKDYQENCSAYEDVAISLLSSYVKKLYGDLGNKSLSNSLIEKVARTYLKIQNHYREHGLMEPSKFKKFLKKLQKKGELFSAVVITSNFADYEEFNKMVVIVRFDVVEGIGSIDVSFLVSGSNAYNFYV